MSLRKTLGVLGRNTGKYKTFPVPIEKDVTKIDKDGDEKDVTILKNKIYW